MADTYANKGFTIALTLFALFLAGYAFLQSPFFSLREIELVGNDYLTTEAILEQTGLSYGINLLEIDLRRIGRELAELPMVAGVKVSRRFPSGLRFRVEERRPVAYLPAERGFWTLDEEGRVLYRTDALTKPIPLLTASPAPAVTPGARLDEPHLLAALRFVSALSLRGQAQLSEIHATPGGITAYTDSGVTINLGVEGEMREKAGVLEALLTKAAEGNVRISHIDVRHPRSPVVQER